MQIVETGAAARKRAYSVKKEPAAGILRLCEHTLEP